MSLLSRLRDWIASLFGSDGGTAAPAAEHVCAVCGTTVDDPAGGCPLCGSLDVEPRDGAVEANAGDGTATADGQSARTGSTADDDGERPGPERRSVKGTTDDAVTRLTDVRDDAGEPTGPDDVDAGDG